MAAIGWWSKKWLWVVSGAGCLFLSGSVWRLGRWWVWGVGVRGWSWSSVLGVGGGDGLALGPDVVVEAVETLGLGAVEVEPPVTDEVLLVEDGAVGAEESKKIWKLIIHLNSERLEALMNIRDLRVFGESTKTISCANVESLAFRLGVSVVA